MSEPFLAEIKIFGFNFPPRNWAFCDGQILPINQNQSLYSLLGTTYGGDGRTSFGLPDLRGRVPIHITTGHTLGSKSGEETHTLSGQEVPVHSHTFNANPGNADNPVPTDNVLAAFNNGYIDDSVDTSNLLNMRSESVSNNGSGQGHENMQPSTVVNFSIAITGLFPSRN
jgi:microcystin-dependent protein